MKSYLESVLKTVSPGQSEELIERENKSISMAQLIDRSRDNHWFEWVRNNTNLHLREVIELHQQMTGSSDIVSMFERAVPDPAQLNQIFEVLEDFEGARRDFNSFRIVLGLRPVRFTKKVLEEIGRARQVSRKAIAETRESADSRERGADKEDCD